MARLRDKPCPFRIPRHCPDSTEGEDDPSAGGAGAASADGGQKGWNALPAAGTCHTGGTNVVYEVWQIPTGKPAFSLYQLRCLQNAVAVRLRATGKETGGLKNQTYLWVHTSATATDFTARSLSLQAAASPEITL